MHRINVYVHRCIFLHIMHTANVNRNGGYRLSSKYVSVSIQVILLYLEACSLVVV